jgi:hypothetical protein
MNNITLINYWNLYQVSNPIEDTVMKSTKESILGKNNANRQLIFSPINFSSSQNFNCAGKMTDPEDCNILNKSQENFKKFLRTQNRSKIYCPILCSIANGENSLIRLPGFMGFILPRNANHNDNNTSENNPSVKTVFHPEIENKLIYPAGFYHSSNDGKNKFLVQSYECLRKTNKVKSLNDTCQDCKSMWKSIRNNSYGKTIPLTEFNKRIKNNNKEHAIIIEKKDEQLKQNKIKLVAHNETINKLLKRISYWKGKYKTLYEAVMEWRKQEEEKNGFIDIGENEARKWEEFYKFIDEQIDREHFDDEEMKNLHKELIRSETSSLGKFNKSNNKRGIRKTKVSSRILNYALTLATSMGKTHYENEAKLRSLPCWSTLTRYL